MTTTEYPYDEKFPFVGINAYGGLYARFVNKNDAQRWVDKLGGRKFVDTTPTPPIPADVNFVAWKDKLAGLTRYARRSYFGAAESKVWFVAPAGESVAEEELLTIIGKNDIILLDERKNPAF